MSRGVQSLEALLVSLALLVASTRTAHADAVDAKTRAAARKLGEEAVKLFDAGDYTGALDRFNLAEQLVPAPTLGVRSARCLVKLGRLVEASERYLDVTRMKLEKDALPQQRKAQVEALSERDALLPILPSLVIELSGPTGDGVEVALDGKSLPSATLGVKLPVDPGEHRITVKRRDTIVARTVSVIRGERKAVTIELPPIVTEDASAKDGAAWQSVAGGISLGVGGVGLLVGAGAGVAAIVQQSNLSLRCPNRTCPSDAFGDLDRYDTTRMASTVGFLVGGVGLAVGASLFWLTPSSRVETKEQNATGFVKPFVTTTSVGLEGAF
jgi:hypothetical protein